MSSLMEPNHPRNDSSGGIASSILSTYSAQQEAQTAIYSTNLHGYQKFMRFDFNDNIGFSNNERTITIPLVDSNIGSDNPLEIRRSIELHGYQKFQYFDANDVTLAAVRLNNQSCNSLSVPFQLEKGDVSPLTNDDDNDDNLSGLEIFQTAPSSPQGLLYLNSSSHSGLIVSPPLTSPSSHQLERQQLFNKGNGMGRRTYSQAKELDTLASSTEILTNNSHQQQEHGGENKQEILTGIKSIEMHGYQKFMHFDSNDISFAALHANISQNIENFTGQISTDLHGYQRFLRFDNNNKSSGSTSVGLNKEILDVTKAEDTYYEDDDFEISESHSPSRSNLLINSASPMPPVSLPSTHQLQRQQLLSGAAVAGGGIGGRRQILTTPLQSLSISGRGDRGKGVKDKTAQ